MNEDRNSRKKAHELEMANLRNITEKLRTERNDAQVKIQVQQRRLTAVIDILTAVEKQISDPGLSSQIKDWLGNQSKK